MAPKRCGHMDGKDVIDASEMVEKVRAAVEARGDALIIARTDARAVEGLDAALERARRYRDAGADLLFVEAPETEAGDRRGRRGVPRRAARVQLGRRRQDARRSRSSASASSASRS